MNAIYVRQSVDRVDSISIESQIEHCMYEVKKEQYRIYKDRGFSGKNVERPDFQLMMEHIGQGLIKRVIIYKLDRISRSLLDFTRIMETFETHGVEFISATEKFDTSTPTGRAMLKVCMVFAELERETIQARVIDAYVSRSRAGFYMGGRVPYGFKREAFMINGINTSRYVPIEDEIKQLQTIFEVYARPATAVSDVAKHLQNHCITKTRGVAWSTPRLSELMRNPIYVKADADIYNFYASRGTEIVNPIGDFIGENGCYLYTKHVVNMGTKKDMTQYGNMVLVIAPHKGIIDAETWIKCRLKGDLNKQIPNRKRSYVTWVSGKLKCGICGYALRYNRWVGKKTANEYYLCSEVSGNHRCLGFGSVRKEMVESVILEQLQAKVSEIEIEQLQPGQSYAEINTVKIAIANKEKEIDDWLDKFEGGGEAVMRRLNQKIEAIERDVLGLKQELLTLEMNMSNKKQLDIDTITKIFMLWENVPIKERQEVTDILIKKVLVTDKSIDIHWKV